MRQNSCLDSPGTLYPIFITLETPLSGMSKNPARTLARHFEAAIGMPIGFISWPPLSACWLLPNCFFGCAAASALAKLHHANDKRCIFRHGSRRFDLKETIKHKTSS
jgi:aquaporin Z